MIPRYPSGCLLTLSCLAWVPFERWLPCSQGSLPPPLPKPWLANSSLSSLSSSSVLHSALCALAAAPSPAEPPTLPSLASQPSQGSFLLWPSPQYSAPSLPLRLCAQVALPSPHPRGPCLAHLPSGIRLLLSSKSTPSICSPVCTSALLLPTPTSYCLTISSLKLRAETWHQKDMTSDPSSTIS